MSQTKTNKMVSKIMIMAVLTTGLFLVGTHNAIAGENCKTIAQQAELIKQRDFWFRKAGRGEKNLSAAGLYETNLRYTYLTAPTFAVPPAPMNDLEYSCSGGDWKTLKFGLPKRGNVRMGIVFKNGDNRKAGIANKNNVWEFTFVDDMKCKEMFVINRYRSSRLYFRECSDDIDRYCFAPL